MRGESSDRRRRSSGRRRLQAVVCCVLAARALAWPAAADAQTPPAPLVSAAQVVGDTLSITFDADLDDTSVPVASSFAVSVGGSVGVVAAVAVSGAEVEATLAVAVVAGTTVSVSYTAPSDNPLKGANGAAVANFSNRAVTNETPPRATAAAANGSTVTLTYDASLDGGSTPATSSYFVEASLLPVDVRTAAVSSTQVTLTLDSPVQAGQSVTVSYSPPASGAVSSADGVAADALSFMPASNSTAVTVPALQRAEVDGALLDLVYSEDMDRGSLPIGWRATRVAGKGPYLLPYVFEVRVSGEKRSVLDVWITGATVRLRLEHPVLAGETVTLSYTPPESGERRLQDTGGTAAPAVAGRRVTNLTAVPVPELWSAQAEGTSLVLSFSRMLDRASVPQAGDFSVSSGSSVGVTSVTVDGSQVVLTLASPVAAGSTATVSYVPASGRRIRDTSETAAAAFSSIDAPGADTPVVKLAMIDVVDGRDMRMYPDFHPDTLHYGLTCRDTIEFSVAKQAARTNLVVEGEATAPRLASQFRIGDLGDTSDIVITLRDGSHVTSYVLHCISPRFPIVTVLSAEPEASVELMVLLAVGVGVEFLAAINSDGVPLLRHELNVANYQFKIHPEGGTASDGEYRYTYFNRGARIDPAPHDYPTYRLVVLDENLVEIDRVDWVPGASNHVNLHDVIIKDNGNYILTSYALNFRDLSHVTALGAPLKQRHPVRDSVITEITPDGEVAMQWSSHEHVDIRDCLSTYSPRTLSAWDYAHVNSLDLLDGGDVVVSLRGCSQVFRIDGDSGETVWKVGRSNSTSEAWRSNLISVAGDPYGEFCGQHAASILDDGNLLLFDNGNDCLVDPATLAPDRPDRRFTRVVEYSIDETAKTATFVRHHSEGSRFDSIGVFRGWVDELPGGNWLVSWGAQRLDTDPNTVAPAVATVAEVAPDTNEELLTIRHAAAAIGARTSWYHPAAASAVVFESTDVTAPEPVEARLDGRDLVVLFDEDLDASSALAASDFTVTVAGQPAALSGTPRVSGRQAELALVSPAVGAVTVGYRGAALRDFALAPNAVAAFGPLRATPPSNVDATFPPSETGMRSVAENTPAGRAVGAPVAATDPDRDALTYALTAGGDTFDINASTGQLLTKAPLDHESTGLYAATVTVSDNKGSHDQTDPAVDDTVTVSVTVADVDEAPEIRSGPAAVAVGEGHDGSLGEYSAVDPEGATVVWASLGGRDGARFEISDAGSLSFAAAPDFETPRDAGADNVYEVTVRAADGTASTSRVGTREVAVTVTDVNEAPDVSGPESVHFDEARASLTVGSYRVADPEGRPVAWSLNGDDAGLFRLSSGVVSFRLAPDFETPADDDGDNVYEFGVSASDGTWSPTLATEVTVGNAEEPGSLELSSQQPRIGIALSAELSDPDLVSSTVWAWERAETSRGPWTAVGSASPSYTPAANDRGRFLRVRAVYVDGFDSGNAVVKAASRPVALNPADNEAPRFASGALEYSVNENARAGARVGAPVTATDAEDTLLTYTLAAAGGGFVVDRASGQIRVASGDGLDHETTASHTVTVTAADSLGATATKAVAISVRDVNEAPIAENDSAVTGEDAAVTVDVLSNDSEPDDGDALNTVSVSRRPQRGSAVVQPDNRVLYTPGDDYHGLDVFRYRVTDQSGLFSEAEVRVTVDAVNDAPRFEPSSPTRFVRVGAAPGTAVGAPVTATDVDDAVLAYRLSGSDASSFRIAELTGQIVVADGARLDGGAQFTFTVEARDSRGATGSADVTVSVVAVLPRSSRSIVAGPGGGGGGGAGGGGGGGGEAPAGGVARFVDVDPGSVHARSVGALWVAGITSGCGREPLRFCPSAPVTRAQMATFLVRALDLEVPAGGFVGFVDVDPGSVHAGSVGALWVAGVTSGCGREPLRFCPSAPVTRAQMATFLVRALGLEVPADGEVQFIDVDPGNVHAGNVAALWVAGVTMGCGREPLRFCPSAPVTRAQMATFLVRALGLEVPG